MSPSVSDLGVPSELCAAVHVRNPRFYREVLLGEAWRPQPHTFAETGSATT